MKKVAFLTLILPVLFVYKSQAQQETKTMINGLKLFSKVKTLGLYVSPEAQFGQFGGTWQPATGLSGMLLVNNKFAVGLSGYTTAADYFSDNKSVSDLRFGGLSFEYITKPNSVLHLTFPLLIGMGQISSNTEYDNMDQFLNMKEGDNEYGGQQGTDFIALQPGINLEGNLFKYGKLFLGARYRLGIPLNDGKEAAASIFTSSQVSGLSLSAGLKLGLFDYPIAGRKRLRLRGHQE